MNGPLLLPQHLERRQDCRHMPGERNREKAEEKIEEKFKEKTEKTPDFFLLLISVK